MTKWVVDLVDKNPLSKAARFLSASGDIRLTAVRTPTPVVSARCAAG